MEQVVNKKSVNGAAAVMSFFIPGLGQLYKGQVGSAVFAFFVTILGYFCFIFPGFFIHAWVIYDALKVKKG